MKRHTKRLHSHSRSHSRRKPSAWRKIKRLAWNALGWIGMGATFALTLWLLGLGGGR